jgi:1-acyl-sn-glycerol-3-phosphate acyltransferase
MAAKPELISHAAAETASADRRDAFYWRFMVTGTAFALFGVGALLLSAIVMPLVSCWPAPRSHRMARRAVQWTLRLFVGFMHHGGGMTYEFRHVERLGRPGQLIVANHPSLLDAVFLLAFAPRANCVVKHAMFRNPLTRMIVRATGYISNELSADMIEGAAAALREGQTVIMFPEGTRSRPGAPMAFHRGAANIAVRAARVLTPVFIRCEPTTLTKAEPWYRIPPRRPHFALGVGEDFELSEFRAFASIPLGSRACNERLCAHFREELPHTHGAAG